MGLGVLSTDIFEHYNWCSLIIINKSRDQVLQIILMCAKAKYVKISLWEYLLYANRALETAKAWTRTSPNTRPGNSGRARTEYPKKYRRNEAERKGGSVRSTDHRRERQGQKKSTDRSVGDNRRRRRPTSPPISVGPKRQRSNNVPNHGTRAAAAAAPGPVGRRRRRGVTPPRRRRGPSSRRGITTATTIVGPTDRSFSPRESDANRSAVFSTDEIPFLGHFSLRSSPSSSTIYALSSYSLSLSSSSYYASRCRRRRRRRHAGSPAPVRLLGRRGPLFSSAFHSLAPSSLVRRRCSILRSAPPPPPPTPTPGAWSIWSPRRVYRWIEEVFERGSGCGVEEGDGDVVAEVSCR